MLHRRHVLAGLALAAAFSLAVPSGVVHGGPLKADRIVVIKHKREMRLVYKGRVVRRYRIALGFAPKGHKRQEGDGKTPEGTYAIDWRNPKSRFTLSLHISYPNRADRLAARKRGVSPGGAIFIHGLPPAWSRVGAAHVLRDWTLGCIAVTSEEIREIWNAVPNGTPIEIRP